MAKAAIGPLQALGPVGAVAGGAFGAIGAFQNNSAVGASASREARDIVAKGVNDKQLVAEQFGQYEGGVAALQGSTGGPTGSNALNFSEIVSQAAGDVGVDIKIIDDEMRSRLDSLRERVKSATQSPIVEGIKGGMFGAEAGSALATGLSGISAAASARSPYFNPSATRGLPGFQSSLYARPRLPRR